MNAITVISSGSWVLPVHLILTPAVPFQKWPRITRLLPAMGYGQKQIDELEQTINSTPAELVIIGTPIDLKRFMNIKKPTVRVQYELEEINPKLDEILRKALKL